MEKLSEAAKRKRKSRERLAKLGVKSVEVKLSEKERKDLTRLCEIRGGVGGAYSADEYISTLIRRDKERLEAQLTILYACTACGAKPAVPGGEVKHDDACWRPRAENHLAL